MSVNYDRKRGSAALWTVSAPIALMKTDLSFLFSFNTAHALCTQQRRASGGRNNSSGSSNCTLNRPLISYVHLAKPKEQQKSTDNHKQTFVSTSSQKSGKMQAPRLGRNLVYFWTRSMFKFGSVVGIQHPNFSYF